MKKCRKVYRNEMNKSFENFQPAQEYDMRKFRKKKILVNFGKP